MFKSNLVAKESMDFQLNSIEYFIPLDIKKKIMINVENELKNYLNFFFNKKNKSIRIWTTSSLNGKKSEELIHLKNLPLYLNQANFSFIMFTEKEEFEPAYYCLKKTQIILKFVKQNIKIKNFYQKEYIISFLNEIVFLKEKGLIKESYIVYNETLKMLKEKNIPKLSTNNLINNSFLEIIKSRIEKLKLKLRVLLSYCLTCSEDLNHQKAILKSEKAVICILDILLCTILVTKFYLYKILVSESKNLDNKVKILKMEKIGYFKRYIGILDSLVKVLKSIKFLDVKNMSVMAYINQFDLLIKKEFPGYKSEKNPDLSLLNNLDIIQGSYLNESTILTLSNLNYFNYEDVFVSKTLKNEITEISLLEKISFLILSFYVLATEHRFIEHSKKSQNPFYKFLLNYFIDCKRKDKIKNNSEIFLTKSVEICYLYAPDRFPLVNQILSVYKKFELNRPKIINEFIEDNNCFTFLKPLKNGFKSNIIIPIIKNFDNKSRKKIKSFVTESKIEKENFNENQGKLEKNSINKNLEENKIKLNSNKFSDISNLKKKINRSPKLMSRKKESVDKKQKEKKISNLIIKKTIKLSGIKKEKRKKQKRNYSYKKTNENILKKNTQKKKYKSSKPSKRIKSKKRVSSSDKYVKYNIKTKSSYLNSKLSKMKFNQRIKKLNLSQTLDNFIKNKKKLDKNKNKDKENNLNNENNFFMKKKKKKNSKPIEKIVKKIKELKMKKKINQSPPQKLCFDLLKKNNLKKNINNQKNNYINNSNKENISGLNKKNNINYNNINNFNFIINSYANGQFTNLNYSQNPKIKNQNFKINKHSNI